MSARLLAVGLTFSFILSTPAAAQLSGNSSANWVTAGPVHAVARSGSTVFLGGDFNAIAPKSQETGGLVTFLGDGTRRTCSMPAVHGTVYAVLQDPTGFFIGGRFDRIGDIERHNLARITVNCAIDLAWSGTVDGTVNALASAGGVLFVGGAFTQAGQQGGGMVGRTNLASFSGFAGVLTSWNPTANGEVHALQVYQPTVSTFVVYAGGDFTVIGGLARAHFGAVDETGAATAFVADANARVLALHLEGLSQQSRLVVGGEFTMLAGTARNRLGLVVVDNNTTTVDAAFDPDANGTVRAVAVAPLPLGAANRRIFAAGDFTAIGGASKRYVAEISAAGVAQPFAPEPNGPVRAIALESSTLITRSVYIGGRFTELGGAQRLNAGRVDPTTGAALGWNPSFNGIVHAIASAQQGVFGLLPIVVGGEFSAIGAYARHNLAAVHLDSGDLLPFAPRVDGVVRALVVDRGLLYMGGDFEHVDQQPRGRLASFTTATRALTGWNPTADGPVHAVTVRATQTDTTVFVAGDFTAIGSTPRGRVAGIDTVTGLATSWTPPAFNATVNALTQDFEHLYAGGAFTNVGGAAVLHLTRLRLDTGTRDATWTPSPNGEVRALCADNNLVHAGGVFTVAGGAPRSNLVQLDAASGTATNWQPEPDGAVNALACWPSLYAGGAFTTIGTGAAQQTRHRMAALSPTASGPSDTYATNFAPVGLGVVQSISANTDGVLAGARGEPLPTADSIARVAFFAMDFVGAPGPPTLPTVVVTSATPIGSAAVRLRWVAPARGPRPTSYRLYAGSSPGASNFANGLSIPSNQFDVVAPIGVVVYYRVQAVNAFGGGPLSDELAFTINTSCSSPPDTPDITANVSASGVTIDWTSSGEPAAAYRLEASTTSGGSDFVAVFPSTQTSVTVPAPPGVYYVRMRAIGPCGTSLPSSELVVRTGASSAPTTPPLNVGAGVDSQNSLRVSWSPPAGGTATMYRLEAGTGFGLSNIGVSTTSATTVWFTNVPGGTYYLRVYAIGGGGTSAPSDEVILVWPDFTSGVSPQLSPTRSR